MNCLDIAIHNTHEDVFQLKVLHKNLTPWSTILLEMLIVIELVKFYLHSET